MGRIKWNSTIKYFEKLNILTIYQYYYLKSLLARFGPGKNKNRIAHILSHKEVNK